MNKLLTPLQRQAILAGRSAHYRFRPVETVARPGWVGETVSVAPPEAIRPLAALKTANIPVKTIYVLHEAPKLLTAPVEEKPKVKTQSDFKTGSIVPDSNSLAEGLQAVAQVFVAIITMLGYLFVAVISVDPACVVELSDGSLVEVTSWYV
jgi:hypothetical protein